VVREFAAFVAATAPLRYAQILPVLAQDPDWTVRVQLALGLHAYLQSKDEVASEPERSMRTWNEPA
jgi:hypothetical protein